MRGNKYNFSLQTLVLHNRGICYLLIFFFSHAIHVPDNNITISVFLQAAILSTKVALAVSKVQHLYTVLPDLVTVSWQSNITNVEI